MLISVPAGPVARRIGPAAATLGWAALMVVGLAACSGGGDISTALTGSTPTGPPTTAVSRPPGDATGDAAADTVGDPAGDDGPGLPIAGDGQAVTTTSTTASSETAQSGPEPTRPSWLGQRTLPTDPTGAVPPQTTPVELIDRQLPTVDTLPPPPPGSAFTATVDPFEGDPLARSTWTEGCPVAPDDLRYLTMTFWGFDDRPHTGEMVVHASAVDDIIGVFEALYEARFPIEEMRIVGLDELDAPPTGDGNNTTAFVCRAVVGGTRFSEHAYGLAVDVNPFHNPYRKGDVVLPELATAYLDRSERPGVIVEGGVVVTAFDAIGWGWGGRWNSLDDHHHFSHNNR